MASTILTAGQPIMQKNYIPGVRRLFIANFFSGTTGTALGENITYTLNTANTITALTLSTGFFYTFDMNKEVCDVQDIPHANAAAGTLSFETNITIALSQYTTAMRNQMQLLGQNKLMFIIETRQGQYFLIGSSGEGTAPSTSNGVDMVDSTGTPGKAFGDNPGWTLIFNAVERVSPIEIAASVIPAIISN